MSTPPFVDLWGWFNGYHVQALREKNADLLRLVDIVREVWRTDEPDPNHALALCNEAIALAQQLKLPCLALFYGYWRCQVYVFYLHQSEMAVKEAVNLVLEAQKPEHRQCPVLARVYYVLINAYHRADSYGYAPEIAAMLDLLEKDVPLDEDTWLLTTLQRSLLATDDEDYEKALELTEVYRARCGGNRFRQVDAYMQLCWLNFKLKRFELIGGFAAAGEGCARAHDRRRDLCYLLGWKAYALFRQGQTAEAQRTAAEATRQAENVQMGPSYHGSLSYYYEARGEPERALRLRRDMLAIELASGSLDGEANARLEICKLIAKMNLPLAEELALARKATEKLRRPEKIREKLDRLERGEILD